MKSQKIIFIVILGLAVWCLYRCKREEIILHGEISGLITDAQTNQPLQAAIVILIPANDTVITGVDGKYLFKSLTPGSFQIQASKQNYAERTNSATVTSAYTTNVSFALDAIPAIHYSKKILDFGFNLTSLSFTISKTGSGIVSYSITPSKGWINVNPGSGEVDNEIDSINVTINRTGLTDAFINEWIVVRPGYLTYEFKDTIKINIKVYNPIIFNPDLIYGTVTDIEGNVYKTIQIGSQVWLAENLRTKKFNDNAPILLVTADEKWKALRGPGYCWHSNDEEAYKNNYGALYNWYAVNTEKLCPTGWHVPSDIEWHQLALFLDPNASLSDTESSLAGDMIKEAGTTHWIKDRGVINAYGFTALPNGIRKESGSFDPLGYTATWWSSTLFDANHPYQRILDVNFSAIGRYPGFTSTHGLSVRCVKDL
jgi:uncharacterized protein (TIGR02145 family)